ncbi:CoA transferase subunit A [Neobacillus sp. C211]|jgi:acetate CoA/acetoacetate CoA-transferase alpha subunit|uniref:CoA transferase subunit A n=1 Tax=Priestia megaterium TaxID=1404 RepID=A0A6H1P7T8_PRIMG|nr:MULTISPECIES: CoA transferase subunit A [Bacillaceae]MBT2726886.1 CoA transferase subunit A [Bacillus sp. ISL-75]MBT2737083.1 CoA transferase subunit A [Bacillus sp. ISL-7]PGY14130.1 CoA transferase subunit A [Bacillus sp. AFS031507]QIZ09603.1 CoA transferase subunit A [Priestia megaterium]SMQ82222.1 6-acetamido-3-oxohexanoate:acetyl-CoA CoA transferase alpha subunit [Bacillus sp. OV166]
MENPFRKITTLAAVMEYFHDGMTLMFGGFGGVGSPPALIDGILEKGVRNITLIGNDTGFPQIGIGKLVSQQRAAKVIASHIGSNPFAGQFMHEGKLEVEFSPQGILAERIRAGGVGLPAILSDIGTDNEMVTKNKPFFTLGDKKFLVETALTAEVSIVYAKKADEYGNLIYDKSARNTNPLVAMAGDITIAEVEEIVPLGSLDPDAIITPGVFVDYVIPSKGVNWKWAWQ